MSALTNFKKKLGEILDKPEGTNPIIDVLIQLEKRTSIPRFLKMTYSYTTAMTKNARRSRFAIRYYVRSVRPLVASTVSWSLRYYVRKSQ